MHFAHHLYTVIHLRELKERDHMSGHELSGDGTTGQTTELLPAKGDVLFDLYDAELISAALCLNRHCVMIAPPIHAYVYLVSLDLAHATNRRTDMVLKRVAGQAGKDVDQAVIPESGQ